MQQNRPTGRFVRFGSFEADLQEGTLTKMGSRVRLQEQPFRILVLLLERSGQIVTREEIRQNLWSHDTFVGFDDALNTAVRKLREALNDSADNPRFLETVPRRGYRFVAPVAWPPEPQDVAPSTSPVRRHSYLWLAAALIVAGSSSWRVLASSPSRLPNHFRRHHRSRRFCQQHGRCNLRRYAEDGTQRFSAAIAFLECTFRRRSSEDLASDDPSGGHETHARDSPRALPAGGQQSLPCRSRLAAWAAICAGVKGGKLPERRHAGAGAGDGGVQGEGAGRAAARRHPSCAANWANPSLQCRSLMFRSNRPPRLRSKL